MREGLLSKAGYGQNQDARFTPDRQQSKTLYSRQTWLKECLKQYFHIAICRQSGDEWQLKALFLTIFDLHSSIVLTFSISAYSVRD